MAQYETYNLDLLIKRNDTLSIDITFVDDDEVNVPASTFSSGRCQIRKSRNQSPILSFDTTSGAMVITDGNINLNKTAAEMDIKEGIYIYDIELTMTTGSQVVTAISGLCTISDDITI
jgi:hypothetical protein